MASSPVIYDGIRHYLFILPILALLAAGGWNFLLDALQAERVRRSLLALTSALAVLPVFFAYLWLHPYYYIFFNGVVGGLSGSEGKFDSEYYGLSFREATELLNEFVDDPAFNLTSEEGEAWRVSSSGAWWSTVPYLSPELEYTIKREAADFFISYTRGGEQLRWPGHPIGWVARDGVVLNFVLSKESPELLPIDNRGEGEPPDDRRDL